MQNVNLIIPDDVYNEVSSQPNKDTPLNVKFQTIFAIGMFVTQEVTLLKAAQLAGQNLVEFMDTLKRLGLPTIACEEERPLDDMTASNMTPRCIIDEACGMLQSDGHAVDRFMANKQLEKELEYGN